MVLTETVGSSSYFFFVFDFLGVLLRESIFFSSTSLSLSSEKTSIFNFRWPFVSLSLRFRRCFSRFLLLSTEVRSLELSRLLEFSLLDFPEFDFFRLLRVLVYELPVEYPVSFLVFFVFLE